MVMSLTNYKKMMANPERSERARRAANTREFAYKVRKMAIESLMKEHQRMPTEKEISDRAVEAGYREIVLASKYFWK